MSLLEFGLTLLAFGAIGTVGDMVWTAWKTRPMPRHRAGEEQ